MTSRSTLRLPLSIVASVVLVAIAACNRSSVPGDSNDASAGSSSAAASSAPTPAPTASVPVLREPIQLLRLTFTSGVEGKEPVDELQAAEPGMAVHAHVRLRNRSSEVRKISLVFRVNGDKRTNLELEVQPSWSYRTWAFNTLRKTDTTGEMQFVVKDDTGAVLAETSLPIRGKAVRKPAPK